MNTSGTDTKVPRDATEPLGMSGDVRLLLNGEWEFAEGPDGDPPTDGWERVRVPHRSREFEDEPPESGWYRTELRLPRRLGRSRAHRPRLREGPPLRASLSRR